MNRGVLIIGITNVFVTGACIFVSLIYKLGICLFFSCSTTSVVSLTQRFPPALAFLPLTPLGPALALTLGVWIWQLVALRRMGERGLLIFAATFPVLALVAVAMIIVIASISSHIAPINFTLDQLWEGEFGLVVWPLLVSIIAWMRRAPHSVVGAVGRTSSWGILAFGIASIPIAGAGVFFSNLIGRALCINVCSPSSMVSYLQKVPLPIVLTPLGPALALTLGVWIWQLSDLRGMGDRRMCAIAALFPVIAIVAIVIITVIASTKAHIAPINFTPVQLWEGEYGLVAWPLLVCIVALIAGSRPARLN